MAKKSEILQEAERLSSKYRSEEAKRLDDEKEQLLVDAKQGAENIRDQIMEEVESRIFEAAKNGKNSLVVMEICAGIYAWQSEGVDMSHVYNANDLVYALAFELVSTALQDAGLNPTCADVSSHYGESMPTIKTLLLAWDKA